MRDEVRPEVLRFVDERYLTTGSLGANDVLRKLGIRIVGKMDPEQFEYAWKLPGGGYLVTIWSEDVKVHPDKPWLYVDTLDTVHRRGGGERDEDQQRRAERRVRFLRELYQSKGEFIGLLQINRIRIELLEQQNLSAKVSMRVKDIEHWHVASWDEVRQRAVLVRGPRGWVPSQEEVEAILASSPASTQPAAPADSTPADPEEQPRVWFPDQEHRDRVEAASMAYVKDHYRKLGYKVDDVSPKNLGYDLVLFDQAGRPVQHVEVKGTSMDTQHFFLTRNESKQGHAMPTWRLAIVTSALTQPQLDVLTVQEMDTRFGFEPLVWTCQPIERDLSEGNRAPA
jgi:hypothetical protein